MITGQVSHLSSDVSRVTLGDVSYYVGRGQAIYISDLLAQSKEPINRFVVDLVVPKLTVASVSKDSGPINELRRFTFPFFVDPKVAQRAMAAESQLPRYIRAAEWLLDPKSTVSKPRMSLWKPALGISLLACCGWQLKGFVSLPINLVFSA